MRSPARFSRRQRLTQSSEYGRVFARPVRSSDRYFTVLARPSGGDIPRLGLAISKKAEKRASERNRLKRLAREAFRGQNDLPPWDFVVMARRDAPQAANNLLRESLEKHFTGIARRTDAASHG